MLEYIKGTLSDASPLKAVVENSGLGYLLFIPLSCYPKLPQIGKEVIFYISTVIREDSHKSYGFLSRNEKDLFEKLNEVSGIGPKTALAIIGHMEIQDLQIAIKNADALSISKVPGIGKKTAERLIIELRDKVQALLEMTGASMARPSDKSSDAIHALIHLGYTSAQAQKAVKTVLDRSKQEPALPELITAALRSI